MSLFYSIVAALIVLGIFYYTSKFDYKKIFKNHYFLIIFLGFTIRLVAFYFIKGYNGDLDGFKNVSILIFSDEPIKFYETANFSGYPPVYVYILYFVGLFNKLLKFNFEGNTFSLFVKFPAMLADILTAIFIYKITFKISKEKTALIISLAYLLNPAIILISSVWGQYESIYTLFLVLSIYNLLNKDFFISSTFFAFAIFARPLNIIFLPIYIYGVLELSSEYKKDRVKIIFFSLTTLLITSFILIAPFYSSISIEKIYNDIVGNDLPYASVNAYNIYSFLNSNWVPIFNKIGFLSYEIISNIFFSLLIICSIAIVGFLNGKYKYFFAIAFLNTTFCLLTIRIHERYMYSSILFLLATFIYKRNKRLLLLYVGFSITFLVNCVDIMYVFLNDNKIDLVSYSLSIFSFANLILGGILFFVATKFFLDKNLSDENFVEREAPKIINLNFDNVVIEKTEKVVKLSKRDLIYICSITFAYAIIAFSRLGNNFAPTIMFEAPEKQDTEVLVEFDKEVNIKRIQLYLGPRNDKEVIYSMSNDKVTWTDSETIKYDSVFAWKDTHKEIKKTDEYGEEKTSLEKHPIDLKGKYLKIKFLNGSSDDKLYIMEMALRDENDELIPVNIDKLKESEKPLFDESTMVPKLYNFMNSTYFDEVYYPRTAFEMVNKLDSYEWTHPQLGKVFIYWGVLLFGMNPFGWRFAGTLFGVLMVPFIYIFGKRIFKNSNWALFATMLFTFDFMHFTQTRISTIDTYITFFVILMYYYMYKYYKMSFYDTPLKKTLVPLFFSGMFMGMGIASKWPGVYAGLGLAVIFFYTILKRYREYKFATINNIKEIKEKFWENLYITGFFCIIFFIVIPVLIYFVSYYPYYVADYNSTFTQNIIKDKGSVNLISYVLENQDRMFNYHAHLNDTHPYSSEWWKWILDIRPIAYYFGDYISPLTNQVDASMRGAISAFGNPAVWWMGIAGLFYAAYVLTKRKSETLKFLLISYFAQLLPWTIITTRTTFVYHYFPCIPFLVLIITYFFKDFVWIKKPKLTFVYAAVVLVLFIMFYPVISGLPVKLDYVNYLLRWFPSWWII